MPQVSLEIKNADNEFKPSLFKYLNDDNLTFAEAHGIVDAGMPTPSLDEGVRVAVWHTTVPNHIGELGVLAACVNDSSFIAPRYKQWFCGMISNEAFDLVVIEQDAKLFVPRILVNHANFGPHNLVSHKGHPGAFDLLMAMYRR